MLTLENYLLMRRCCLVDISLLGNGLFFTSNVLSLWPRINVQA